jgi:phytoene dehydrogenase-like protein
VRGLVLAGSSVFPGPGVEAVVISGVLAAHAIDPSGVELLGVHRQEGQAKVA